VFRIGRTVTAPARSEAFEGEPDSANVAGVDRDFGIGDAIGSVIHATMFGLIRTFDSQSYQSHQSQHGDRTRRR